MKRRFYALRAYGLGPFPQFFDSFSTLDLARKWAKRALDEGYHTVEIYRDAPERPGYFGVERDLVEEHTR